MTPINNNLASPQKPYQPVEKNPIKIPYPLSNFCTTAPLSLSTNSLNLQPMPFPPLLPPPVPFHWMANPFIGNLNTLQIQLKTQQLYNQMQAQSRQPPVKEKKLENPQLIYKSINTHGNAPVSSVTTDTSNKDIVKISLSVDRYNRLKKMTALGQSYLDSTRMLAKQSPEISDKLFPPDANKICPKRVYDRLFSQWRINIHQIHNDFLKEKKTTLSSQNNLLSIIENQEFVTKLRFVMNNSLDNTNSETKIIISEDESRLFTRWRQIIIGFLSKEFQEIINTILNIENSDIFSTLEIEFTDANIESGILNTVPATPCLTSAKANLSDFGLS